MISIFGHENGFNKDLEIPERCSHKALLEQEFMMPKAYEETMSQSLNQTSLHGQSEIHHHQSTTSLLLSTLMSQQELRELVVRKEKEPEIKEDRSAPSEKEKTTPTLKQDTIIQNDQKDKKDNKKSDEENGYRLNK